MISVEHLEPHPNDEDPYGRESQFQIPRSVDDTTQEPAKVIAAAWQKGHE